MSTIVDKQFHIADFRARQLEQMAAERGITEDALIEKGLDMLFREQDRQAMLENTLRESKDALLELKDKIRTLPASTSDRVDLDGAVLVVGTLVAPERIIHLEQQP